MRQLAEFEKYADAFAITEDILCEQGFRRSPPDFYCLVVEESGILTGLLVYYFVAFTYRAKPNIVVKERLGAKIDPDWHEFQMSEEAFRRLAES